MGATELTRPRLRAIVIVIKIRKADAIPYGRAVYQLRNDEVKGLAKSPNAGFSRTLIRIQTSVAIDVLQQSLSSWVCHYSQLHLALGSP